MEGQGFCCDSGGDDDFEGFTFEAKVHNISSSDFEDGDALLYTYNGDRRDSIDDDSRSPPTSMY